MAVYRPKGLRAKTSPSKMTNIAQWTSTNNYKYKISSINIFDCICLSNMRFTQASFI